MLTVLWNDDVPREYRDAAESILNEYLWLVPPWCRTLRIQNTVAAENGETAAVETRVEYRWAKLTLTPWFLEGDAITRTRVIAHELLHISLTAAADVFANVVAATDNEPFKDLAKEEWRKALEAGTQDLAYAIAGREED